MALTIHRNNELINMTSFLSEDQIQKFENQYDKLREHLLVRDPKDSEEVYARKLQLLNNFEFANRVFLVFSSTGELKLEKLLEVI